MNDNGLDVAERKAGYSGVHVGLAAAGTLFAAWVLSFFYGAAEHYSPLIYLNLVLAYAFGWLVGRVGCAMLRKYRIDSKAAATLVGLAGGVFAVYFAWPAYLWVITGFNFSAYAESVASPALIADVMGHIAENPLWKLGRGKSSGMPPAFYYLVWLGELILVVGVAAGTCRKFVRENLLCELCGDWVAPSGDFARFAVTDEAGAGPLSSLSAGDLSLLPALPRASDEDASGVGEWIEVRAFACPNCRDVEEYVNVVLVTVRTGKKDDLERSEKVLARLVKIDAATERALFEPAPAASGGDGGESGMA